jgi:hypothetical protein
LQKLYRLPSEQHSIPALTDKFCHDGITTTTTLSFASTDTAHCASLSPPTADTKRFTYPVVSLDRVDEFLFLGYSVEFLYGGRWLRQGIYDEFHDDGTFRVTTRESNCTL